MMVHACVLAALLARQAVDPTPVAQVVIPVGEAEVSAPRMSVHAPRTHPRRPR